MADMIYRQLGRTGLKVSIVGYGASPLGAEFGKIDPAEGTRAVHYAIDHGLNYFDVAPYYGRTLAETRLARPWPATATRSSWPPRWPGTTSTWRPASTTRPRG